MSAEVAQGTPPPKAREMHFELSEGLASHWCPSHPEFSHAASAFMAALPHLEPYFIHNIREAAEQIEDPRLKQDVELFVAQEARHAQQHRRLNQLLAVRYPELPRLERAIKQRLDHSRRRHSLAFRMAYTSGYEAITYQLVCFMMEARHEWLTDADPHVLALLSWHGAEEVEHKAAAFDVLNAIDSSYLLRMRGFVAALAMTVKDILGMTRYMLRVDGLWGKPESRRRLWRLRLGFLRGLLPRLRHYLAPGYDPKALKDPDCMLRWVERYHAGEDMNALQFQSLDA
ncbi:MAG: metal-dependent hydrolase [Polyangiales bacterium]